MRRLFTACVLLCVAALLLGSQRPPWRARRRPDAPLPNRLADVRVKPADWGQEPESPPQIDPARLASALSELCAQPNAARARKLGDAVIATAQEHALDPFLLAALAFRGSYCRSDYDDPFGLGLTALPVGMYQNDFKRGSYLYRVRQGQSWATRERPLKRFPFIPAILQRTEGNLYFAANLLQVWREQHQSIDEHFEQVPHRHFVSHWFWGDRVKSARDEDRLFTDRRRLLGYYGAPLPAPTVIFRGVTLGSPLDGAPRVVSSGLGFARDEGRSHRGIDVESDYGEPVRAIADGLVVFSGVDLPGQKNHVQLKTAETNAYPRGELGHGGRYVCIQHPTPQGKPLRSCSMHLETVDVAYGAKVKRGDRIGRVGRTGVKSSPPHLHLELFALDELLDPLPALRGPLIGTPVEFEP
jgi:murein DD-endopeptidase MepM/ murein hydrolase activator NlpD